MFLILYIIQSILLILEKSVIYSGLSQELDKKYRDECPFQCHRVSLVTVTDPCQGDPTKMLALLSHMAQWPLKSVNHC